jgi:hypothetical protein
MTCPGSVREEARYPETSSSYAEIGTLIHEVAAAALMLGIDVPSHKGLTEEHLRIARDYVNFVRGLDA